MWPLALTPGAVLPAPAYGRKRQVFRAKPCIILGHQQKAATTSVQARKQSDRHIKSYFKIFQGTVMQHKVALHKLLLNLEQHLCKSHLRAPVLGVMTDTLPFYYHSTPLFITPAQGLPPTYPNTITSQLLTAKQCFRWPSYLVVSSKTASHFLIMSTVLRYSYQDNKAFGVLSSREIIISFLH